MIHLYNIYKGTGCYDSPVEQVLGLLYLKVCRKSDGIVMTHL